jgi:hypothetical protein
LLLGGELAVQIEQYRALVLGRAPLCCGSVRYWIQTRIEIARTVALAEVKASLLLERTLVLFAIERCCRTPTMLRQVA